MRNDIQDFFEEEQRISDQEKQDNVTKASEEAKESVSKVALNSANIIGMVNAQDGEVLNWMYRTLPPQNSQVEVKPAGIPKKGGGSKSRRKKDKKGNKAYTDPWTGI